MARVFISGSSAGLGLMAGQLLAEQGHHVALHVRNEARVKDASASLGGAAGVVVGDLLTIAGMRSVADQVNKLVVLMRSFTTPASATASPGLGLRMGFLMFSPSTRWRPTCSPR